MLFLIPLFGFVFNACEDMVSNVSVPEYSPKLVVFSYISPSDSIITVKVKKSSPVFGTNTNNPETITVTDANVVISNGLNSKTIPYVSNYYNDFEGAYIISQRDFAIYAGQSYKLEVSSPGGFYVTSSCFVPAIPETEVAVDHVDSFDYGGIWVFRANFHFKDIPEIENYWRLSASRKAINPSTLQMEYYDVKFDIGDYLVSDAGKDGSNISYLTNEFEVINDGNPNFIIDLFAIDYQYYIFHKEADLAGDDYGNPFSEPVVMISNINGGLGLFSAYNKRTYSFNLSKK